MSRGWAIGRLLVCLFVGKVEGVLGAKGGISLVGGGGEQGTTGVEDHTWVKH